MNNLYICGFMGCGKSTIGVRLAKLLGRRFLDLDAYVEKRTKMSIATIFKNYGEDKYRDMEHEILGEVSNMKNAVVAVGGGTFAYEENIVLAKQSGKIIYLFLPFEACYRRIKGDKKRPLVINNSKDDLLTIYNRRHTIYKIAASYVYEAKFPPEFCARQIAKLEGKK